MVIYERLFTLQETVLFSHVYNILCAEIAACFCLPFTYKISASACDVHPTVEPVSGGTSPQLVLKDPFKSRSSPHEYTAIQLTLKIVNEVFR